MRAVSARRFRAAAESSPPAEGRSAWREKQRLAPLWTASSPRSPGSGKEKLAGRSERTFQGRSPGATRDCSLRGCENLQIEKPVAAVRAQKRTAAPRSSPWGGPGMLRGSHRVGDTAALAQPA